MAPLSPRALRLIRAGEILFGARWHAAMARATGLSQTYVVLMSFGSRQVTDQVEATLLATLQAERKRLRAVSSDIAAIIAEIKEDNES